MRAMDAPDLLKFNSPRQWRAWLEEHHADRTEAWLLHYKKGVEKQGVSYREALDEALSYGWIDTKLKSIDESSFMLRWVPRKPGSLWSKQNRDRAEELIKQGRMTPAGVAAIEDARKSGKWDSAYTFLTRWEIPDDLRKALAENPAALGRFEMFANSPRNQYIYWVNEAKTAATRQKRIAEAVRRAELGQKPG
jgi:uncharacterized protein YdeI (YjbR/CyaY-like superfamily)